jgi:hypothetical protein
MAENKKPVKVIRAGDMSPETKALPDETRPTPKGTGEDDMLPNPKKGVEQGLKAYGGKEIGKALGIKKGGKITAANYDKEYGKIYRKAVKKMSSGGSTASKRADGIAVKGKTRGKIC